MIGIALAAASIGSSIYGAKSASDSSKASNKTAKDQLRIEAEHNTRLAALGDQAWDRENQLLDYLFNTNTGYADALAEYDQYARDWQDREFDLRLFSHNYADERLANLDWQYNQERNRQLEQLGLNNQIAGDQWQQMLQDLTASRHLSMDDARFDRDRLLNEQGQLGLERDSFIELLMQDKALKQRERDDSMGRLYSDRTKADVERNWSELRYDDQLDQLARERAYELARNEYISNLASDMGSSSQRALAGLGSLTAPEYMDEGDLMRSKQMFMDQYGSAADRAVDRIASVNEAQLINAGMDTSTTGDMSRRDLLQQQAMPIYNEMVAKATQDALGYITGMNENIGRQFQDQLASRERSLSETSSAYIPEIEALLGIRQGPTAASGGWGDVQSSIYDREALSALVQGSAPSAVSNLSLRSGNDYRTSFSPNVTFAGAKPIDVGMSTQINNPIALYGSQMAGANIVAPSNLWNPLTSASGPANFMGQPNTDPLGWQEQANNASLASGQSFGNAIDQAAGLWNQWSNPTGFGTTSPNQFPNGGPNWSWVN